MQVIGANLNIQATPKGREYLQATGIFLFSRLFLYLMVYLGIVHYPTAVPVIDMPLFSNVVGATMAML